MPFSGSLPVVCGKGGNNFGEVCKVWKELEIGSHECIYIKKYRYPYMS